MRGESGREGKGLVCILSQVVREAFTWLSVSAPERGRGCCCLREEPVCKGHSLSLTFRIWGFCSGRHQAPQSVCEEHRGGEQAWLVLSEAVATFRLNFSSLRWNHVLFLFGLELLSCWLLLLYGFLFFSSSLSYKTLVFSVCWSIISKKTHLDSFFC